MDEPQHSPTPPRKAIEAPAVLWEVDAIPWTFGVSQPTALSDGWEPIGVGDIEGPCLIVRRQAP